MTLANWIEGEWRAAVRGGSYALGAPITEPLGRWPRSSAEDLELALAAALSGGPAWREWSRAERLELLLDALEPDLLLGDPEGSLAARLSAEPREVEAWVSQARRRGRWVLERRGRQLPPDAPTPATTALVRVHGAALFGGLLERLWPLLLEGWAVVLLADAALPMVAREVALALDHADLPAGTLSLLCDDGSGSLRAALLAPEMGYARLLDLEERRADVLELADRPRGREGTRGRGRTLTAHFEALSCATRVVRAADDPELAAREVAAGALGRCEALSGQREGQIGRVLIHRRLFSRFSEALLTELDRLAQDPAGSLALLDPELPRYVERLRRLGLDEGATLLRGDVGTWLDERGAAGSRRRGRNATLEPLVFTNVEPRMRLARAQRPSPVLRLLRADDDDEALRCADELGPP